MPTEDIQEDSQKIDVDVPEVDETEAEARAQGWVPEEEYKGKAKWRSAEEFLEFGEKLNPILKKQRDEYENKYKETKVQLDKQAAAIQELLELRSKKDKEEYEGQISFLKAQLKLAKRNNEYDTVDVLEEQLEDLQAKKPDFTPPKVEETQPVVTPEYTSWLQENESWFEKDEDMTKYAIRIGRAIRAEDMNMTPAKFFNALNTEIKERFPDKFKKRVSMVEGTPSSADRPAPAQSYAKMPADAKSACDRFVADKLGTQADYVKLYWSK